jgi:hypothetical protein
VSCRPPNLWAPLIIVCSEAHAAMAGWLARCVRRGDEGDAQDSVASRLTLNVSQRQVTQRRDQALFPWQAQNDRTQRAGWLAHPDCTNQPRRAVGILRSKLGKRNVRATTPASVGGTCGDLSRRRLVQVRSSAVLRCSDQIDAKFRAGSARSDSTRSLSVGDRLGERHRRSGICCRSTSVAANAKRRHSSPFQPATTGPPSRTSA